MIIFENMVLREIENIKVPFKGNLNKVDRKALKELSDHPEIIVRPADKGGGIVLLSKEKYDMESNRILNDASTYIGNNPAIRWKK